MIRLIFSPALLLWLLPSLAQQSVIDPLSFGVVLDDPAMKKVRVKKDVTYFSDGKSNLHIDIYSMPGLAQDATLPAIIFLNAVGDRPGEPPLKTWGIYTSWPQLMAAQGYIGISMETDASRVVDCINELFHFIDKSGKKYNIDPGRLGVYAASANVRQSVTYLMGEKAYKGIRAAALYYGGQPPGPFRKDLPVMFVVAEGDVGHSGYKSLWEEVLRNNAPWTIRMASGLPHAFDAFSDNDEARRVVRETIAFWKNNLDPVPRPSWNYSKARDIIGSTQMNKARSLELLKSLTQEHPNDINALTFYANTLRDMQQKEEAATVFQRILKLEPKNIPATLNYASLLYGLNRPAEADTYIAKAVNSGEMKANDFSQLGFSMLVLNKNKEAALYYEKAISLRPRNVDYYNLACAYAKQNEKEKAVAALSNSIKEGYGTRQQIESDTDFDLVRGDERFKQLVNSIR